MPVLILILAILFIVYVVIPLATIVLIIVVSISSLYALVVSLINYISATKSHSDPYATYTDKNPNAPSGVKRNYFFGPGYHQVLEIVKEAYNMQNQRLRSLSDWFICGGKNVVMDFIQGLKYEEWYFAVWAYIFFGVAYGLSFTFGFMWITVFSVALLVVDFTMMCGFYIFFTTLWGIDRFTLFLKSIQSRCPNCKRTSVVPVFSCPQCGRKHEKLTPSPYGVFNRKCACGKILPVTVFNGRSELEAVCPFCASELAASDARQFGLQLVGSPSAGKTTFLAAFLHIYREYLDKANSLSYSVSPETAFTDLEDWFQSGISVATNETNANMYSIVHKTQGEIPVQFTIYDIAGEAFTLRGFENQQLQFEYCEGIIVVIDPSGNPGEESIAIATFINAFKGVKGLSAKKLSDIPVAVIISKADLYKTEIGLPKIKFAYSKNSAQYIGADGQSDIYVARDVICKEFLKNHGFGNVINEIEGTFNNIGVFPVSAMGHGADSTRTYTPWGVTEPVSWLLTTAKAPFPNIIATE